MNKMQVKLIVDRAVLENIVQGLLIYLNFKKVLWTVEL